MYEHLKNQFATILEGETIVEFYRYYDTPFFERVKVLELKYYLIRETPKGYWISSNKHYNEDEIGFIGDKPIWVSKTSRKRFAYPTREDAKDNFIARKNRQIKILKSRLKQAKDALYYFDEDFKKCAS